MGDSACHRALRVAEILYEIAYWSSQQRRGAKALVRFALVCKAFSPVSIDILWRDFDAGLDALLGCVPSYVQRVKPIIPHTWGVTAPKTTEGTELALTESEASALRPLARRLRSLMMIDDFLNWSFLLAIREADLPLKLGRVYISQFPRFWNWELHHHLILTPDLRDLQIPTLRPTWPTIFTNFANLAPKIEFLFLDGQSLVQAPFSAEEASAIEEHMLPSITALSQLRTLRLPPISESNLIKLLPRLALLPNFECLYSEHNFEYGQLEGAEGGPSFSGFPAFQSLHWGHGVTFLPHLFRSIRSPNFSSLHIAHRIQTLSSDLKDVFQSLTKLHGSTLASFIHRVLPAWAFEHDVVDTPLYRITIDTLGPLLDCRNLTILELTGHVELRLLPDDIQKICNSLTKLQSFQAATDIVDDDGNSLLTTIDLQPFSRLPDLERLFIQFDGSEDTVDELEGLPESTSKLRYFDVSTSAPPASARDFVSVLKRMFPELESLSYETATDSTGSELSDDELFEDKPKPRDWDKVSRMLKRKRGI